MSLLGAALFGTGSSRNWKKLNSMLHLLIILRYFLGFVMKIRYKFSVNVKDNIKKKFKALLYWLVIEQIVGQ